jgi:hypothetical protein
MVDTWNFIVASSLSLFHNLGWNLLCSSCFEKYTALVMVSYDDLFWQIPKLLWFSANSAFLIACFESVRVLFMSQRIFHLYCGCQHVHFSTPWRTVAVTFKSFHFKCYSDVTLSTLVLYVISKMKNIMGLGQVNGRSKNQPSFTRPFICNVDNHL